MYTLYLQIAADIENDIHNGIHLLNKKLPSIRDLSTKYSCSHGTAIKAYETLKNKHIIYSLPQSGYYIVENVIKNEDIHTSVVDFSTGNPLMRDMHIPDLNHCLDRATDIYQDLSLSHTPYGVESLRKLAVKYLADFQVFTAMNNIFINLGIQQALSILAKSYC